MSFVRWNQNTQIWEVAVNPDVPTTLFNHLPVANPTLPLDIANKAYVDAAAGSGFVPITGGTFTGKVDFTGGSGTSYSIAPIEIRMPSHPRVGFHWPGVVASQIGMDSTGTIRTYNNPGTGYEQFHAASIQANGYLYASSYIYCGGVMYPGRIDAPGNAQTSWYIAGHGSYGLYINTGLYVEGNVYVGAHGGAALGSAAFQTAAIAVSPSTVVLRDGSGDINFRYGFASYVNSSDDVSGGTISNIMAKFQDNYHRSATAAKVQVFLGLGSAAYKNGINGSSGVVLFNGNYGTMYFENGVLVAFG